jgi:hypothetical protein
LYVAITKTIFTILCKCFTLFSIIAGKHSQFNYPDNRQPKPGTMKYFLPLCRVNSLSALCCIMLFCLPVSFFGQNECTSATPLTVYTTTCGAATAGTTVGATQSMPGCTGTADDDVWFSFVPDGGAHTVTVTSPAGPGRINDIVSLASCYKSNIFN